MAEFRSWADYENRCDMGRSLIIYGSGVAGRHFININKLKPLCFCDERADDARELVSEDLHIYPIIKPNEIRDYAGNGPLNVLVALTKIDHILSFLDCAVKMFPEDTAFYFYHCFNFEEKKIKPYFKDVIINGEYVFNGKADVWNFNIVRIMDNFENIHDYNVKEHLFKLKSCYKNPDIVDVAYLKEKMTDCHDTFLNGCFTTVNKNRINRPLRKKAVRVYLFGNCQLQALSSSYENGFENFLYLSLNKYGVYDILNYSNRATQRAFDLYRQLLAAAPEERSIALFCCSFRLEELQYWVLSKQYCDKLHCRFIGIPFAEIYDREVLSEYEKYLLTRMHPVDTAATVERLRRQKNVQRNEFTEAAGGYHIYEIYYFSEYFRRSKKALFVDAGHLADWGNEALAHDVTDMILQRSVSVINPDAIRKAECRKFEQSLTWILPDFTAKLELLTSKIERAGVEGAIVMNANPFTLGHRFLIETAANACEHLYVFVVEEDRSQFCFADRIALVREGTRDMENVSVLPGSELIISGNTFSEYFIKDQVYEKPDVTLDLHIFGAAIAQRLNIKTRFVGEEPLDRVTRHYNEEMKRILPGYGVNVVEIKRRKANDEVISASRVRKLLKEGRLEETEALVPETTLRFLKEKYGG